MVVPLTLYIERNRLKKIRREIKELKLNLQYLNIETDKALERIYNYPDVVDKLLLNFLISRRELITDQLYHYNQIITWMKEELNALSRC